MEKMTEIKGQPATIVDKKDTQHGDVRKKKERRKQNATLAGTKDTLPDIALCGRSGEIDREERDKGAQKKTEEIEDTHNKEGRDKEAQKMTGEIEDPRRS